MITRIGFFERLANGRFVYCRGVYECNLLDSSNPLDNMHNCLTKFTCFEFAAKYWTDVLYQLCSWNSTGASLILYVSHVLLSFEIYVLNQWHIVCLQNSIGATVCTNCQPGAARLCCSNNNTCANNGHHSLFLNYIEGSLTHSLHAQDNFSR